MAHVKNDAVNALNALPLDLQVDLTRSLDGEWTCEAIRKVRGGWESLDYSGEGPTANEAAAAFLTQYRDMAERERIDQAIAKTNGDKTAAAALLGISRKTLYRRLERLA